MIKLYIDALEYDISDYIDESSIVYSDNIDETRAHGGFTIPFIKPNVLTGLDMSKPLPRLTPFVIIIDDVYTYWKLAEDRVEKVRKGDNPLYSHEVSLIEPTVDLENRPMPDMTVTQPQGILNNYIYDINILADEETIPVQAWAGNYETTGVPVANTLKTLAFDYGTSTDPTVIEDNVLKEIREYDIQLNYEIYNVQVVYISPEATMELGIYANDVLISDIYTIDMLSASLKVIIFGDNQTIPYVLNDRQVLKYTPTSVNEVITIKARTLGLFETNEPIIEDTLWITKMGFNILTYEENTTSKTTLDEVVDKILLIQKSAPLDYPTQEFTLAETTRTRLSTIPSPEFKFSGYTMFDDLNEVASYVGAIVYIGESDFTTIHFYFYDDVSVESGIDYLEEEQNVYLNDYVTAFEINAQNVINEDNIRYVAIEPSETGWLSIRTDDIKEITDDNAVLQTSKPFYKNNKLLAKGLAFTMYDSGDNPVTFASTLEWDISNFVVEQTKWNALENQGEEVRTGLERNKGNTVYYTQGQKMLKGLGYNDVILAPEWTPTLSANFAIVEAILCQAALENPTYHFADNYKPTISLFDMLFRIYYMPYSNARVMVYRDDAATLNQASKYFNEQASINDMKSLGDITKRQVNLKGNAVSTYRGFTTNIYNLLNLGMKNDRGEVLTSYEVAMSPKIREFVLHYSKDNPNISAYKGTPSAYRQYQIPSSDLVFRKDKYSEFVYFSETDEATVYTIYDTDQILANFKPIPTGEKLTYAVVEFDYTGGGYTETVEATVDTLSFGNTSALVIEMQDNYSAGFKQVADGTIIRNSATPYGDDFGNVENIKITTFTTKLTDSDNYPDNDTATTTGFESQLELVVKKDAREIWGVTKELVFR